jgi:DMSO/TMAO reductase YedYZ heme-binding membrane subunit
MGIIGQTIYSQVMGFPLISIGGAVVGVLLLITLLTGGMLYKGKGNFTLNQHRILAIIAVVLALLHGLAGMLAYMGF